jgi:hypothetical protein
MERNELIDFLARLIADGVLDEEEAQDYIRQFDAGLLDDWQLPLAPAQAIPSDDRGLIAALVLLLTAGRHQGPGGAQGGPPSRARLSPRSVDLAQLRFEGQMRLAAGQFARGELTAQAWQATMNETLNRHLVAQALTGGGRRTLPAAMQRPVADALRTQSAYLSRFVDVAVLRANLGSPFSPEYLASRAALYSGAGRDLYFRADETARLLDGRAGVGVVLYFRSRDDRGTCSNCLDADRASPYLPGSRHPIPGSSTCQGYGNCRCRLEYVYDPAAYARLTLYPVAPSERL